MSRSGIEVMKRLIKLVLPLKSTMFMAISCGVCGHLCAIFIPVLGAMAITGSNLQTICIILPIIALLRGIFHLLEQNRNHYLAFTLLALIRDQVFGALRRLCPAKLEGKDKGNLIAIITADIELLEVFYAHTISPICIAILVSSIMVCMIGSYHIVLGIISLLAYVVVGAIVPVFVSKKSKVFGEDFRKEFGNLDAYVLDSLRGVKESIQYNTGESRLQEIYNRSEFLAQKDKKLKDAGGSSAAFISGIVLVFDMILIFTASYFLEKGMIDSRGAIISVVALMSSFGPVIALSNLGTGIQNTLAAGNRVLDILDESPILEDVVDGKDISFEGASCSNIDFSYDEELILKDFSIDLPKKGIIGISGKSGSGKSTLLKLLMRFWDVDSGSVQISKEDIRSINTKNLRDLESFVTQDTVLFHDSIENNLRIANPNATMEEIIMACKKASIHDFIVSLPKGYQTNVGELGESLSGGERQRLGVARAFLHDSPFVLLDEPTSNLDSLNEAIVLRSLKEYGKDKTILLVSHRKSTLCISDQSYLVENGRMS